MKMFSIALAAACALASTTASAKVVEQPAKATTAPVSTCYHVGTYYTAEATYYVYDCYDNGDGSF